MIKRRLIDTNLIVRFLVQDHEAHARKAQKLFEACDRGEISLVILPIVLAETVFVLESFYQLPRTKISEVLSRFITSPGIILVEETIYQAALKVYAHQKLHFVDCVLAAHASDMKIAIASFDLGLKKMQDVTVDLD